MTRGTLSSPLGTRWGKSLVRRGDTSSGEAAGAEQEVEDHKTAVTMREIELKATESKLRSLLIEARAAKSDAQAEATALKAEKLALEKSLEEISVQNKALREEDDERKSDLGLRESHLSAAEKKDFDAHQALLKKKLEAFLPIATGSPISHLFLFPLTEQD